jgi:ABC-type transporter Mla maintaining outer membrane lipid asymmetry permease subunit MlaE
VFLAQQVGLLSLSDIGPALTTLVIAGVGGAVLFGLLGWALGRLRRGRTAATPDP